MNRLLLVAACITVSLSGAMAYGQYVVASPPVAVYQPVPVAVPVTTVYQPIVSAYAPVVAYRPIAPSPMVYSRSVAYGTAVVQDYPGAGYFWPTVVVPTRFYVPGQPVRNVLRAVAP